MKVEIEQIDVSTRRDPFATEIRWTRDGKTHREIMCGRTVEECKKAVAERVAELEIESETKVKEQVEVKTIKTGRLHPTDTADVIRSSVLGRTGIQTRRASRDRTISWADQARSYDQSNSPR